MWEVTWGCSSPEWQNGPAGRLEELDELIARRRFPSRSQAIEAATLDPAEEKALAEEGMGAELAAWPEY